MLELVAFRAFGWRLDPRYVPWIVEDVRSGRALRWRWLTCGVIVVGTQLMVGAAFGRRVGSGVPLWPVLLGGLLGLLLGSLLVRRMGTERYVARVLRAQGLLLDGSRDPSPSWTGRLDNYGVASIQMALIAFLGLVAGVLPAEAGRLVGGTCRPTDARTVAALRAELRPGLALSGLRTIERRDVSFVAGVVEGRGPVTWQRLGGADGPLIGAVPEVGVVTPALGPVVPLRAASGGWVRAQRRVVACAERAAARGEGPNVLVALPTTNVPSGTVQLRGAVDLDLTGFMADCDDPSGVASAAFPTPDGSSGFLLVRGPTVTASLVTLGPSGGAGRAFTGRAGAVTAAEVVVAGELRPMGVPPGPTLTVAARLPCR